MILAWSRSLFLVSPATKPTVTSASAPSCNGTSDSLLGSIICRMLISDKKASWHGPLKTMAPTLLITFMPGATLCVKLNWQFPQLQKPIRSEDQQAPGTNHGLITARAPSNSNGLILVHRCNGKPFNGSSALSVR